MGALWKLKRSVSGYRDFTHCFLLPQIAMRAQCCDHQDAFNESFYAKAALALGTNAIAKSIYQTVRFASNALVD